jgi:hypothetical protein
MDALDGNAIAGLLYEHFGCEMTTATGTCIHCRTTSQIAELRVYNRAPGTVVRCRHCGNVVIVLVNIHDTLRADLSWFQLHDAPGQESPSDERAADR